MKKTLKNKKTGRKVTLAKIVIKKPRFPKYG
jgi:hypothetical protein